MAKTGVSPRVIAFKDCFMGRIVTMASVGDNHAGREGMPIAIPVDYMPFYDPAAVAALAAAARARSASSTCALGAPRAVHPPVSRRQHACFIFELMQGEGGFNVGDRDYFKALMDVCKAHNIAVWDDEIQSFGRTERMFAYEHFEPRRVRRRLLRRQDDPGLRHALHRGVQPQARAPLGHLHRRERLVPHRHARHRAPPRWRLLRPDNGTFRPAPPGLPPAHAKALIENHPEWFPARPRTQRRRRATLVGGAGGMMRFTPFGGDKDRRSSRPAKACFDEGVHPLLLRPRPVPRPDAPAPARHEAGGLAADLRVHRARPWHLDETGPTEIGGLILQPAFRGHALRLGAFLSFVRFHFIAQHRERFASRIIAEMMGRISPDGVSLLWEYLGRRFVPLSYSEADRFCQYSREFMMSLLPREAIYLSLLPPEARSVIGEVHAETVPARRLLERIGFASRAFIDPFDGGPVLEADTESLELVRSTAHAPFAGTAPESRCKQRGMVSVLHPDGTFLAVATAFDGGEPGVKLPAEASKTLRLEKGVRLAFTPAEMLFTARAAKPKRRA
jgi:arginine N-succinyltransferase